MQDYFNKFEIMFDDAQEYLKQKKKKIEEVEKNAKVERRNIEKKGECEKCGNKGILRWVRNKEFYLCYQCFIEDLQCEASVQVPMRGYSDMTEYVSENEWNELWEFNE